MKHILLLVLLVGVALQADAQHRKRRSSDIIWLTGAVKGGYGISTFFNSDITADPNVEQNFTKPHYGVGGRFGLTFFEALNISAELLSAGYSYGYELHPLSGTPASYEKTIKVTSMDLAILARYTGTYGGYVEFGPKISTLKDATVSNTEGVASEKVANIFKENYSSLIFGTGLAFYRSQDARVFFNGGVRVAYGFQDYMRYQDNLSPVQYGSYEPAENYSGAKTNPFSASVYLELDYYFGYYGMSTCRRGHGLRLFQP